MNSILQQACATARAGARTSPDRPMAGKTGTTENYGDAWFVGYTPQLAVAVWVGYPTTLKPMLTEFRRRAGRGRHLPRPDLEVVRREGAEGQAGARLPVPVLPVHVGRSSSSAAATGCCSTTASATLTQGGRLLRRAWGRRRRRTASRTRSTCRTCAGSRSPTRRRGSRRSRSRRELVYKPAEAAAGAGDRRRPAAEERATARRTTGSSSSSRRRPRA